MFYKIMTRFFAVLFIASAVIYACVLHYVDHGMRNLRTCGGYEHNLPDHWAFNKTASLIHYHPLAPQFSLQDWQIPHYEKIQVKSRYEQLPLSAYWIEVDKKAPVILVIHGIQPNCKTHVEPLMAAAMVSQGGFNVLLLDMEGYGDSAAADRYLHGARRHAQDVLGAIDWLQDQGFTLNRMGLLGISLGGTTASQVFALTPEIPALWLDSSYFNVMLQFKDEASFHRSPRFFAYFTLLALWQITGEWYDVSIKTAIDHAGDRTIFLTHGTQDYRIRIDHFYQAIAYAKAQGKYLKYLEFKDSDHVDALFLHPAIYQKALLGYLRSVFNG